MARLKLLLGMVLAGGEGKRLMPLTADRAKPAVPFGGSYRLVDFVLSNLVNAQMLKIAVLTQYKSHSLDRHITTTWRMSTLLGNYVTPVPAQQRLGPRWYTGSADAILQNFNLIHDEDPKHVLVFGADHVYRMDPGQMFDHHLSTGAGVTVAAIQMARSEASNFGVIELAQDGVTIKAFHEKPANPPPMPGNPNFCLVSMGNYIFRRDVMEEALMQDSLDLESRHDLGTNIIPMLTKNGSAKVYDFANNVVPGETERDKGYWRDVGSIDAYLRPIWILSPSTQFSISTTVLGHCLPTRRLCRPPNLVKAELPKIRLWLPEQLSPAVISLGRLSLTMWWLDLGHLSMDPSSCLR